MGNYGGTAGRMVPHNMVTTQFELDGFRVVRTLGPQRMADITIEMLADLMAEDPEQVMEEMWVRATQVSSVLENILHEPHGVPRWGLNE